MEQDKHKWKIKEEFIIFRNILFFKFYYKVIILQCLKCGRVIVERISLGNGGKIK